MAKNLFFIFMLCFVACNNDSEKTTTVNTDTASTKSYTWSEEDKKEFLGGCVDNAKPKITDTAAFAHCNCVLKELQKVLPSADSAASVLLDSTRAAQYVSKCK